MTSGSPVITMATSASRYRGASLGENSWYFGSSLQGLILGQRVEPLDRHPVETGVGHLEVTALTVLVSRQPVVQFVAPDVAADLRCVGEEGRMTLLPVVMELSRAGAGPAPQEGEELDRTIG